MPLQFRFKDSKISDSVAKALLFVAKFSKKDALVKFSGTSIGIIWGGLPKTYFIHTEVTSLDMFKDQHPITRLGIGNCVNLSYPVILINPSTLGRIMKGSAQDRNVTLCFLSPNKVKVIVSVDKSKRTITHTIRCEFKTLDDYNSMLIQEVEPNFCRYNTKLFVDNIHCFRHIVDSFLRLNTYKVYIMSKQSKHCNELSIKTTNQGSVVFVNLSDLQNGLTDQDEEKREANVVIDTKNLSLFLSSLVAQKNSKVSFEIAHNKCLKITLDNQVVQGEKFYQSLLLLHSLNI